MDYEHDDQFEDERDAAERFRYHIIVDSLEDDEAHVLDTRTGKTLMTGTIPDCHAYATVIARLGRLPLIRTAH